MMKAQVSTVRRSAAAAGLSLTMLVAAGTGAGAATKVSLTNYTAGANSQTLEVSLQLGVNGIVQGIDLSNISERISWAKSEGKWLGAAKTLTSKAEGQVFNGSLNGLIATALQVPVTKLNPNTTFRSGTDQGHKAAANAQTIQELALPAGTDPIIRLGIGTSKTKAETFKDTATSTADAALASLDVRLSALQSLAGLTDGLTNLENTINNLIKPINDAVSAATNGALDNVVPNVNDLATASILHVGVMESSATTGVQTLARALSNGATSYRTAHAMNRLADVDVLNGLVHLKVIEVAADAKLDNVAGNASATPFQRIVGLTVGKNNVLDLTTGKITLPTGTIAMPKNVEDLLGNLVVKVAGIDIRVLGKTREVSKGHAFAHAESLKIVVAPQLLDSTGAAKGTLFSLTLQGPMAEAGVDAGNTTSVLGRKLTKTGLSDNAFLIVGPMLFGLAILVRRFALSH